MGLQRSAGGTFQAGFVDQAIQLDPNYALAYAERAEAWTMLGDLTGQRPTAYPKARRDAEKAVAIAPALAEAHAALGFEHVQLGLLGDEPAQLVERAVTQIVPRLAEL